MGPFERSRARAGRLRGGQGHPGRRPNDQSPRVSFRHVRHRAGRRGGGHVQHLLDRRRTRSSGRGFGHLGAAARSAGAQQGLRGHPDRTRSGDCRGRGGRDCLHALPLSHACRRNRRCSGGNRTVGSLPRARCGRGASPRRCPCHPHPARRSGGSVLLLGFDRQAQGHPFGAPRSDAATVALAEVVSGQARRAADVVGQWLFLVGQLFDGIRGRAEQQGQPRAAIDLRRERSAGVDGAREGDVPQRLAASVGTADRRAGLGGCGPFLTGVHRSQCADRPASQRKLDLARAPCGVR